MYHSSRFAAKVFGPAKNIANLTVFVEGFSLFSCLLPKFSNGFSTFAGKRSEESSIFQPKTLNVFWKKRKIEIIIWISAVLYQSLSFVCSTDDSFVRVRKIIFDDVKLKENIFSFFLLRLMEKKSWWRNDNFTLNIEDRVDPIRLLDKRSKSLSSPSGAIWQIFGPYEVFSTFNHIQIA